MKKQTKPIHRWAAFSALGAGLAVAAFLGLSSCSNVSSPASPFFQTTATPVAYGQPSSFNGSASGTTFLSPDGIAVDALGNIFVADTGNNRVVKFTNSMAYVTQWAGGGVYAFNAPTGVAVDGAGNVYVADSGNFAIQKFTNAGTYTTTWGGHGAANGNFNGLAGLAVDRTNGFLYVVDTGNSRIEKFNLTGGVQAAWGTPGMGAGQFSFTWGGPDAVDAAGNVYVGDQYDSNNDGRIQKFTSAGAYLSTLTSPAPGAVGYFFSPTGIAVDKSGNQFLVDYGYITVREFGPGGNFMNTIPGIPGGPFGIAVDASGTLYVCSPWDNLVYLFRKN